MSTDNSAPLTVGKLTTATTGQRIQIHQHGRQVVWKFPLELTDEQQKVSAPFNAQVVHFAMQGNAPTLWMLVDEDQKLTHDYWFEIKGTGDPSGRPNESRYMGTTQHGAFVWHLFALLGAGPFGATR